MVRLAEVLFAWFCADFLGLVWHVVFDKIKGGDGSLIRRIARDFQEHHRNPGKFLTPTNLLAPWLAGGPILLGGLLLRSPFLVTLGLGIGLTQVSHALSHRPVLIFRPLQMARIFLTPQRHAMHHDGAFDHNFAVLCGWSEWLWRLLTPAARYGKVFPVLAAFFTLAAVAGAQDGNVGCPPGKTPLCLCACVTPNPRTCETLPAQMPATVTIRTHLTTYFFTAPAVPDAVKTLVSGALVWEDKALDEAFATAVIAARCASGEAPGPSNPAAVPADQVKAWVLSVMGGLSPAQRALRPLIEAAPAPVVRYAYLRAVEVKRGLDYGALGN